MISQEIIEEFFLNMIEELRKDDIFILNDYWENFRDYPKQEEIDNLLQEKEISEDEKIEEEIY